MQQAEPLPLLPLALAARMQRGSRPVVPASDWLRDGTPQGVQPQGAHPRVRPQGWDSRGETPALCSTLQQMVSTVTGLRRPDASVVDCFAAAFPGGSMTGAPKVLLQPLAAQRCCRSLPAAA